MGVGRDMETGHDKIQKKEYEDTSRNIYYYYYYIYINL